MQKYSREKHLRTYEWLLIIAWTAIVLYFSFSNASLVRETTREMAINDARTHFVRDKSLRLWAVSHGGVYVPVDETTGPNQYLSHLKERDVVTPSGKVLTLMNPAYMIRQINESTEKVIGVRRHITSLKLLRPENKPDEWEAKALRSFEKGTLEKLEFITEDGEKYLRLMRPLITEKGCLKCHAHQGYKEGQVRGGVSIALPIKTFLIREELNIDRYNLSLFLLWSLGILGIVLGERGLKNRIKERDQAQEELNEYKDDLEELIRQRTKELSSTVELLKNEIDEHKKTEKAHREAEERWRSLTEDAPDHILTLDTDLNIQFLNYAAPGLEKEELIGTKLYKYAPNDQQDMIKDILGRVLNTSQHARYETYYQTPEGKTIYFESRVTPRIVSGKVVGLTVAARDITERKLIDEELAEHRDHLNELVSHRTSELERVNKQLQNEVNERKRLEQQLVQSQKMEAIGRLAGGIAHDFNNLLMAIDGFAHILSRKMAPDDPLRNNVDLIRKSAEKGASLTSGLLAFSRKQIINLRPLNLNEIVLTVRNLISSLIGEDIDILITLSKEEPVIMADGVQIDQILINLATNARDAMPEGGKLTITTGVVDMDGELCRKIVNNVKGRYAYLSVSDTGTGLDTDTGQRMFDPFFTTKEVGKGTGLGLSVVYGLIKQHGGHINVDTQPGRGTKFEIYLPIADAKAEKLELAVPVDNVNGTETILLVEDNEAVRESTRMILEEYGYEVIEAVNGEDALRKTRENKDKIELVILDVIMPGMNGRETYNEIKKVIPDVKAIFISGYTEEILDRHGIREDEFHFFSKPVLTKDLFKKIRHVLDS